MSMAVMIISYLIMITVILIITVIFQTDTYTPSYKSVKDSKPVCSGVLQGSVLGPVPFLVFINDLPECLNCSCALFANDTIVYQEISSSEDCKRFQQNLNSLSTWAEKWGMSFNISKSKIISFNLRPILPNTRLLDQCWIMLTQQNTLV